jgi:hypothetical protein
MHSEAAATLPSNTPASESEAARDDEDVLQNDMSNMDMATEQTVGLLDYDFDFATGLDSINTMNDLLNNNGDIDEAFPVIVQKYTSGDGFGDSHLSPFARSRVEYSIDQMKLAPTTMVNKNCTPWMHPSLYEENMPQSLQGSSVQKKFYLPGKETKKLKKKKQMHMQVVPSTSPRTTPT